MEDMERYGDYNDTEDDEPKKKSGVIGIIIKVLIAAVCITVIGVIGFRISIFNNYPEEVSRVIFSDELKAYYDKNGGNISAATQSAPTKYDDPDEGNFFFDKLVFVTGADHVQLTVRYNTSLMAAIKEEYGIELDPDKDPLELFDFKLVKTEAGYTPPTDGTVEPVPVETVGSLTATKTASQFMYRYVRLAFDGVDFGLDEGETPVGWFRLDITIKGSQDMDPYMLPVYQYSLEMTDYALSPEEVPK
ncbi:MAG: hypothetical protein IKC87_00990 [Clostridia bacterium]|nr:hypothetical protein [Clostridia bacterium]